MAKGRQSRESRSATAYYRLAQKAARAGDVAKSSEFTAKANKLRDIAAKKNMAGKKATPSSNVVKGVDSKGNPFSFKKEI